MIAIRRLPGLAVVTAAIHVVGGWHMRDMATAVAAEAPSAEVLSVEDSAHSSPGGRSAPPESTIDMLVVPIDVRASVVRWTGTKFRGRSSHHGVVRLASGTLTLCGGRVCGGQFVADMSTIQVTDIPETDPIPRANLTRHLKSADFFWAGKYPTASFLLHEVRPLGSSQYNVTGDLTIRDATRRIAFDVERDTTAGRVLRAMARFRIDRQQWGVSYRFDPIRNEVVDDHITLDLLIVASPPDTSTRASPRPRAPE